MEKGSIGGVLLAIAGIVAGLILEGGNVGQILQPTAALIVIGGTLGAVLVQFPPRTVLAAFGSLRMLFAASSKRDTQLLRQLLAFANKARRQGVVSLDADLPTVQDPFLKQTLMLAVDGTEPADLRNIMRVNMESIAEQEERMPAVFESAGFAALNSPRYFCEVSGSRFRNAVPVSCSAFTSVVSCTIFSAS